MGAQYIDGKAIAALIREELKQQVESLKGQGYQPKLDVVLVGGDHASVVYARSKEKAAANAGIIFQLHALPDASTEDEVLNLISSLNHDPNVHGIMVELPLPNHISKQKIMESIDPLKDVDGVHPLNRGRLIADSPALIPATPLSCLALLQRSGVKLEGSKAVVVGRGETVGKPLFFLLLKQNATVTVCHTRTKNLSEEIRQADILIAAAGKAGLISAEMIKPGAVVIDAGINESPEGKMVGDVQTEEAAKVASLISPVPGGVGACTTVLLLQNVVHGLCLQKGIKLPSGGK